MKISISLHRTWRPKTLSGLFFHVFVGNSTKLEFLVQNRLNINVIKCRWERRPSMIVYCTWYKSGLLVFKIYHSWIFGHLFSFFVKTCGEQLNFSCLNVHICIVLKAFSSNRRTMPMQLHIAFDPIALWSECIM